MTTTTGFSDVDRSGRSAELVDYLTLLASRLCDFRREGYEMLGLRSGTAFLDVGCGAGEVCVEIAAQVGSEGRVAGIDRSAAMIDAAQGAAAKSGRVIDLRVGSAYDLPFPDESFDAVRAERVLQHLEDPEAALREMLRVTKPGGKLLLMDPDHGQAGLAVDEPAQRRVFEAARRSLLSMIVNSHSGVRLRGMLMRAGLSEVRQLTRVFEVPHEDFSKTFFLHDLLDAAVAREEIARADAKEFVEALARREREGLFFAYAMGYAVSGTKQ